MASVDIAQLSKQEKDELICSYAALLLHDDGQEITVTNLIDSIGLIVLYYRLKNYQKSSKPVETKLKDSGPLCSPKHSRDKTLKSSSPTLEVLHLLNKLQLMLLPLVVPQRRKKVRIIIIIIERNILLTILPL